MYLSTARKFLLVSSCCLQATIFFTKFAHAQSIESIPVNETVRYDTFDSGDSVGFTIENDRSYCCQVWDLSSASGSSLGTIVSMDGTLDSLAERGRNAPWMGYQPADEDRKCFIFDHPDDGFLGSRRSSATAEITNSTSVVNDLRVRCDETSLFGGFNTVVTDFNFIEITNTLADTDRDNSVIATIVARGNIEGGEVLRQTITIQAGQRVDVDIHSVASSDFGPVVISHNGPAGALRAINSQYRIINQSPLDFEPSLVVPFREGR